MSEKYLVTIVISFTDKSGHRAQIRGNEMAEWACDSLDSAYGDGKPRIESVTVAEAQ
jgi:hypothetical protein